MSDLQLLPWSESGYFEKLIRGEFKSQIKSLLVQREAELDGNFWQGALDKLSVIGSQAGTGYEIVDGAISVIQNDPLQPDASEALGELVAELIPWRKGPFKLGDLFIDAEWQSFMKWERLCPFLGDLRGKTILDIGCNNGYYSFRMGSHEPAYVLGIDPSTRFWLQFELIQRFAHARKVEFSLMGIEHLPAFLPSFDLVLCMGVLYHQKSPLEHLQRIREVLVPGGKVIVESQSYPGEGSFAFCPPGRYCKARNVYFVPTAQCIADWLEKTGFVDIEICNTVDMTLEEQRRTLFAPFESLEDFLDRTDLRYTVEGHLAPRRTIVRASRK